MNRILHILIFSILFFSSYVLFREPFEFYLPYFVIIFLLPFFALKYRFPFFLLKIMLPLFIIGVFGVYAQTNTWLLFFKIFINIFIALLFFYYVFCAYQFDVVRLFSYYAQGAYFVSMIGVIQALCFFLGIQKGYDYSWIFNKWGVAYGGIIGIRLNSILSEPSYLAAVLSPVFFVSLYNFIYKKDLFLTRRKCIVVMVIYILTGSSVGFIGIFFALILLLINIGLVKNLILFLPVMIYCYFFLYNNVDGFRERMDGLDLLYSGKVQQQTDVHGSSFANYNNFHVSLENFKHNPFLGSGLGSHPIAFMKYSIASTDVVGLDYNKMDANSMALRIMSETGIYGLLFMFLFIRKYFVMKERDNRNELQWIISNACLLIILLQLCRQGNYTYNGFMFYLLLYYFTFIDYSQKTERNG